MTGIRIFELLADLEYGKSAEARLLIWNGETYRPSSLEIVKVHDFVGERGHAGDRGYCFYSEESHRWEVICGLLTPQRGRVLTQLEQNRALDSLALLSHEV